MGLLNNKGFEMKKLYTTATIVGLLFCNNLYAEDSSDLAVGAKIGTLGFGIDGTVGMSEKLNLRVNLNTGKCKNDDTDKKYSETGDLELFSAGLLADYHPFSNGFRVSGGVYYSDIDLDSTSSKPENNTQIGDKKYDLTSDTTTKFGVSNSGVAPYLGIGWGNAIAKGSPWGFSLDVGVMYQGDSDVKLSMSGTAKDSKTGEVINLATNSEFKENLKKEKSSIEDDLNLYPVISLGVSYKF